jgi:hypothetical protein
MTPSKRTTAKRGQPRALQDARRAVQTLKDANRFQGVLLDRLEKAIAEMNELPRPGSQA